jgi:GlpG protein
MYILSLFGSQIEKRKGSLFLVLFVLVTAILSNLAEYKITGNNEFGGMSGVNYGLFGYIWIKSIFDPGDGLYIDQINVVILMAWFFICFAIGDNAQIGDNARIGFANWAHTGGLVSGSAWAYISARKWTRR